MNKTAQTISYITVIAIVSKLFGFARKMVIAAYYGASWQTDAFNMANSIIILSTAILSMGVATVIVPMYNHRLVQKNKEQADGFASNMLCVTSLIYAISAVLGIIFAPVLVRIFAPNFSSEVSALSVQLLQMLLILTVGTNAVNFLSAISRSNNRFLAPALLGFPLSVSTVLFIAFLFKYFNIYAMVLGYVFAVLIQVVMLALSLRKAFRFKPVLNFTNGDVKAVAVLCLPILASIGVDQIGALVDRMLASGLPEGSISAMNYAQKLKGLPDGIITASIIMVIFPIFSKYAAKQDFGALKLLVNRAMSALFAMMAPITLVCIYYSREIVKIVYERGAFTNEKTILTANIFVFAVLGVFFTGGCGVLNNAFYGMQDTKTPRLGAVIAVGCDIILNLMLVKHMQAAGLILATSIAIIVNYMILLIFFKRKCGAFGGLAFLRNIIKCTIATVCMLPIFLVCEFFRSTLSAVIFFAVCAILGLAVYAVLLYVMRADIFMFGLDKIKEFLNRKKFD